MTKLNKILLVRFLLSSESICYQIVYFSLQSQTAYWKTLKYFVFYYRVTDTVHVSHLSANNRADPCRVLQWLLNIGDITCGYFMGVDVVEVGGCLEVAEVDWMGGGWVGVD